MTKELPFEEIYKWLTDYLASHKSLTLERPKSSSFTVTIDSEEHLRIDGASIKKDYFESFFKGTKKGNYYDSHFKRIIEFVYKHYHPNHTSEEIANKFVFIIDEINRGEISKIFGELFFSIDPGYRAEKGKVNTQYQNMIGDGDVLKMVSTFRRMYISLAP